MKILFVGESWQILTTNLKGFDYVSIGRYYEAGQPLINALNKHGHKINYMPSHVAQLNFPTSLDELEQYGSIIFSDVGSNSLLLHPKVQYECVRMPNRLKLIKDYVEVGGGFLMCGGYMSYSGFEGKARYGMTPIADILPVNILNYDDRVEVPEGIRPEIVDISHPILKGITISSWPDYLGYNKLMLKSDAHLIAKFNQDVFMAENEYGNGRVFAFATDCVPHWGTPEFINWDGYSTLFDNIVRWLSKEI